MRLTSSGAITRWTRWSYCVEAPKLLLRCGATTHLTTLTSSMGTVKTWDDPLEALAWLEGFQSVSRVSGPPLKAGWVGWLSYDLGRLFEVLPARATDDLKLPLFEFAYYDRIAAMDRTTGDCFECSDDDALALDPIPSPRELRLKPVQPKRASSALTSNFTRAAYEQALERAINYIAAGDVFQVNLSQRFSTPLCEPPLDIFNRLTAQAGASFGAYMAFDDYALLCNSPELFLRITPDPETGERQIATRPIKGTRPRQSGMEEQLRSSLKDQAELNMIVDLERNDLGRVCKTGSVRVTQLREIEAHPTVYHGVSTIEGVLRKDVRFVDLLKATFPGGSIIGAPKIRAMEIIDELEPVRRGPYCGAIGFISNDGHIEFNIAIRTMIATAGQIHIPVGGGIVADSDPAAEFEETLVKARAMFEALKSNPANED